MKKVIFIFFVLVVVTLILFLNRGQQNIEVEEQQLKQIITGFIGTPYEGGPLNEEVLYRTDAFDCTTLVLISAAEFHSGEETASEMMKKINYYPEGEVSYENRVHFTTWRNQNSRFFKDITREIAPDMFQEKTVVLNHTRLLDIDWEEEIVIPYILKENVTEITLPDLVGVAFLYPEDENIGLDVRHEGFVLDGQDLVHASSTKGEVVKEDFFTYLEESNFIGVHFFEIREEPLDRSYVTCLQEAGVVIYGSATCPACAALVESLGGLDAVKPIYVECHKETERCSNEMKTNYVPEIQINGELFEGDRNLLGQEVNCI
jgi:hypothetical protein